MCSVSESDFMTRTSSIIFIIILILTSYCISSGKLSFRTTEVSGNVCFIWVTVTEFYYTIPFINIAYGKLLGRNKDLCYSLEKLKPHIFARRRLF